MNVIKIYVWTSDMTSRSYFGKMNSTLGSVLPLAMFQILIQEDFFFEFKDKKWVQWCNKYLHENSWFLQCASLVLAKRIHFPTKSSWLLIASLQRLRSKEKVISDNWILLKWLSVEHACIFGSLNSVIKLSLFCCKERSALKLFSRERKIRLFLPRRKILLNP